MHAVIKMVEPTHQSRCTGNGIKPPKGALVKSHGAEPFGIAQDRLFRRRQSKRLSGMNKGDELTVTTDEVSRKCNILSKAAEV